MIGLQHGVAVGRELGADRAEHLRAKLVQRIEQAVQAGFEHPLEPAVAREEGALAILHRQRQRHDRPVHVTYSPHGPPFQGGLLYFRT
jgi:hypothetical protein